MANFSKFITYLQARLNFNILIAGDMSFVRLISKNIDHGCKTTPIILGGSRDRSARLGSGFAEIVDSPGGVDCQTLSQSAMNITQLLIIQACYNSNQARVMNGTGYIQSKYADAIISIDIAALDESTSTELSIKKSLQSQLNGFVYLWSDTAGNIPAFIELYGGIFSQVANDKRESLAISAIILAYNESDVLEDCIHKLHNQGIEVHLIDDQSTDFTSEIADHLLKQGALQSYRKSQLPENSENRWALLLELSFELANQLDTDWIIHHDADEIRESPWPSLSLREGIEIVDSLGYNVIDHTVIEFLFNEENEAHHDSSISPFKRLNKFRFPSHDGNFLQLKAWKKSDQVALDDGGHRVKVNNPNVFPLKFLIKHYPLRTKAQAEAKLFHERLKRFTPEKRSKGWHVHYNQFQYFHELEPWSGRELLTFNPFTFYSEFLLERLSGCGLDIITHSEMNLQTYQRVVHKLEAFRSKLAETLLVDEIESPLESPFATFSANDWEEISQHILNNLRLVKRFSAYHYILRIRSYRIYFNKRIHGIRRAIPGLGKQGFRKLRSTFAMLKR